ncbi:MAG: hypothetical protein NZ582_02860, partial [Acidimicrobiales bacterium]|nr:hypothetical protein [Acidimicrobiales bacterium]
MANWTLGLIVGAEPSSGCEVSVLAESEALIAGGERITCTEGIATGRAEGVTRSKRITKATLAAKAKALT